MDINAFADYKHLKEQRKNYYDLVTVNPPSITAPTQYASPYISEEDIINAGITVKDKI